MGRRNRLLSLCRHIRPQPNAMETHMRFFLALSLLLILSVHASYAHVNNGSNNRFKTHDMRFILPYPIIAVG